MTEHIHDIMPAYLAGELSPAENAMFEDHVRNCPECASELESLRHFWRTLERTFNADTFPERFSPKFNSVIQKEILNMLEKERNSSKWKKQTRNTLIVQIAAMLSILFTLAILITANLTAPSEEKEETSVTAEMTPAPASKPVETVPAEPAESAVPAPESPAPVVSDNASSSDADYVSAAEPVTSEGVRFLSAIQKLTPEMFLPENRNTSLAKILKLDEIVLDTVTTGVPEPPQNDSPFALKVQCAVSPLQQEVRYFFVALVPNPNTVKELSFDVFLDGEDTPLKPVGTYSKDSKFKVYVVTDQKAKLKLAVTLPGMEKPVRLPVISKPATMFGAFPALRMAFVVNAAAVPRVTMNKDIRPEINAVWCTQLKFGYEKDAAAAAGYEMLSKMQKK